MEDSFLGDLEGASAVGFGVASLGAVAIESLIFWFSGLGLACVRWVVRLKRRKLGVMFLCA